jgi:hypothetical protein
MCTAVEAELGIPITKHAVRQLEPVPPLHYSLIEFMKEQSGAEMVGNQSGAKMMRNRVGSQMINNQAELPAKIKLCKVTN